jgi:hypothetical protein
MRIVAFHTLAFEQYNEWATSDKKMFERVSRLITESAKTPFAGIGKPEPLKRNLKDIGPAVSPTNTALSIKSLINKSSSYRASFITSDRCGLVIQTRVPNLLND